MIRVALTRRMAIGAGLALVIAPPALAHRSQSVLTTVTWNPKASSLDVMHRIHSGDAEAGLAVSTGVQPIDITIVRNQAQLMLYVESRFGLFEGAGKLVLSPLGAEIEGEAVLLYQECKRSAAPTELTIDDRILRDVFEAQTNLVNVKLKDKTRTLIFSGGDGLKKADGLL